MMLSRRQCLPKKEILFSNFCTFLTSSFHDCMWLDISQLSERFPENINFFCFQVLFLSFLLHFSVSLCSCCNLCNEKILIKQKKMESIKTKNKWKIKFRNFSWQFSCHSTPSADFLRYRKIWGKLYASVELF